MKKIIHILEAQIVLLFLEDMNDIVISNDSNMNKDSWSR